MPTHSHTWHTQQRLMLTLPDIYGRFDLFQSFACACGASRHCTSSSLHAGRHLTHDELQEVRRQEQLYGAGNAKWEYERKKLSKG